MPQYNRAELGRMATESGFVRDTFEKVLRLKEILRFMNEDEFLREHLLLKGGTAINLIYIILIRVQILNTVVFVFRTRMSSIIEHACLF